MVAGSMELIEREESSVAAACNHPNRLVSPKATIKELDDNVERVLRLRDIYVVKESVE